uniref:GIY-YIG domain-containing protein n=1 Tax=Anopheles maculatus TaxID=74869 RepID=A0A182SZT4_9DIPT
MATLRRQDVFERIIEQQCLEQEMVSEFQSSTAKAVRNFREGHLKKSFIYLLLDPRVSDNLPAQQNHLEPHELWRRFLNSVFYVGKGKSSRPYCHLYDAMKLYQQKEGQADRYHLDPPAGGGNLTVEAEQIVFQCSEESIAAGTSLRRFCQARKILNRKQMSVDSEKLNRIIDIWCAGKGVVCLHVFHNIMPAEAYTREAAIIDAFGVQNLTNLKRGDYYATCLSWPMKKRKQLGILLLYKAMLMHLAEGETQLLPSDLI